MGWEQIAAAYFGGGGGKAGPVNTGGKIAPVIVGTGSSKLAVAMPQMTASGGADLLPGISPDPVIGSGATNIAGVRVPTEQLYLFAAIACFVMLMRKRKAS